MPSPLSAIAPAKRRRLAATLAVFAVLFTAVGAVAATGASTVAMTAFAVVALLTALVLALLGWGVLASVRADVRERNLDAVLEHAVAARGGSMCGCGHDHDPTELHVPDDPCARDGGGDGCTHTCETCILATLRPSAGSRSPEPSREPSP